MAKLNETSIIEQHVEKGVFGIAVLLLLYVAFGWIPSSPRKIGSSGLKPDKIDSYLMVEAAKVQKDNEEGAKNYRDIRDKKELEGNIDKKTDYVKEARDLIKVEPLSGIGQMVQFRPPGPKPEVRLTEIKQATITLEEIAKVIPAPGRPRVKGNLELPRMENEELTDRPTVHLAAVFDRNKLASEWSKLLRPTHIEEVKIVVVAVEAEVRELLPDGTWSEPRAVDGVKLPPLTSNDEVALDENGKPLSVPTIVQYEGDNKEKVLDSIDAISDLYWQEYILQPPYPKIYLPTGEWGTWRVNLPKNEVSDMLEDETISRKYRKEPAKGGTTQPDRARDKPLDRKRRQPTDPRKSPDIKPDGPGGRSPNLTPDMDPRGAITPGNMVAANTGRTVAPLPAGAKPAEVKETKEDTVELRIVPIPTIEKQIQEGKLLILIHDQSIENSKVYQYRVRLVLLNPLYTHDEDVAKDHPNDALMAQVKTPFSGWSHQVMVPKAAEFFITGSNPTNNAVRVTVFTRALGQRVSEGFTVKVGEEIGFEQEIPVVNPDTGKIERRKVDFSTGAVITDLDFSVKVPRGAIERSTVEMLFIDESGRLGSRIGLLDSESSRLKQLRQEVEHARTAASGE